MVKKRSASIADVAPVDVTSDGLKAVKAVGSATPFPQHDQMDDDGMGEFEDAYEDEMEEEEQIVDDAADADSDDDGDFGMAAKDEDAAATEEAMQQEEETRVKAYLPGQAMEEDEELTFDQSTYKMYHALNMEWPCLSFDIFRDAMGNSRTTYPMSMCMVAGTQADRADRNKLLLMRMSRLHRMRKSSGDNSDDSDMDDDDDDGIDEDPVVETRAVPHAGGVNRVRVMPHADVHITASWADTGKVHIWDFTDSVRALEGPGVHGVVKSSSSGAIRPVFTVKAHGQEEGFAMDWSPRVTGRLLTGDCVGSMFTTERTASGWATNGDSFTGHTASVEDVQWSPHSDTVFASCSVDRSIRIWDARMQQRCGYALTDAHQCDVNVISWSRQIPHLLASGADDGSFSVWDLRQFKAAAGAASSAAQRPVPAASFQWHRDQLTSLEWHPTQSSMLAVAGADDQVTLWDFSVEHDSEEMAAGGDETREVPPQLMFIHQGQQMVKELHWHKQLPGVLVTTAMTGINIFKTINSE